MKKNFLFLAKFVLTLMIFLSWNVQMNAQGTGEVQASYAIHLEESLPIQDQYVVNISYFWSNNETEADIAQKFRFVLSKLSFINLVSYDPNTKKMLINLNRTSIRANWSVADWNKYLTENGIFYHK